MASRASSPRGEFALLAAMVRRAGTSVAATELVAQFRRSEAEVYDRSVDVLILRLRRNRAETAQPAHIRTERGLAYVFA